MVSWVPCTCPLPWMGRARLYLLIHSRDQKIQRSDSFSFLSQWEQNPPSRETLTFLCAYGGWSGTKQKEKEVAVSSLRAVLGTSVSAGLSRADIAASHLGACCPCLLSRATDSCGLPASWLFSPLSSFLTHPCPLKGWDLILKHLSPSPSHPNPAPALSSASQNICPHHRLHRICLPTKLILKDLPQLSLDSLSYPPL